jgi:hypothetical protein
MYSYSAQSNELCWVNLTDKIMGKMLMPIDFKFKLKSVWCELATGSLLFTGGNIPASKEVWELSGEFLYARRGDMISERSAHGLVLHGNLVYAISGVLSEEDKNPTCEVFDPEANLWTALSPIPHPTANITPVVLDRTKMLYVIGGYESNHLVQTYNIPDNIWSTISVKLPSNPLGGRPCFKPHGIESTYVLFVTGKLLSKYDPETRQVSSEDTLDKEVDCFFGPCVYVGDTLFCASAKAQAVYVRINRTY